MNPFAVLDGQMHLERAESLLAVVLQPHLTIIPEMKGSTLLTTQY